MPHKLLRAIEHDRERSLGWFAAWWIETFCVIGRGDAIGQQMVLNDDQLGFLVDAYAIGDDGRRLYTRAFYSRPKGFSKSGLAAAICLFEALAPCRFDDWAEGGEEYEFLGQTYTYDAGEPLLRPVKSPNVRILATTLGQGGNTYDSVYYNLTDEGAPLYAVNAYGVQPGLTRILLPDNGVIAVATTGASGSDGGLETHLSADELHLMTLPAVKQAFNTISRNMTKRASMAQPWAMLTTTMYGPGEESIAEVMYAEMLKLEEKLNDWKAGKSRPRRNRFLFSHIWGEVRDKTGKEVGLEDEAALRRGLLEAYGDTAADNGGWIDLDDTIDEIYKLTTDPVDAYRYYLNDIKDAKSSWLPKALVRAAEARGVGKCLMPGDRITLGFDGSVNSDATVLVAVRVSDGFSELLHIQEEPDDEMVKDWAVDRVAVDAAVSKAFEDFEVIGFYADPPFWSEYLDRWEKEFGDRLLVHALPSQSLYWYTKNEWPVIKALDRLKLAFGDEQISFAEGTALSRHLSNARIRKNRYGDSIGKERRGSPKKIDAAMGLTLAWQARSDFVYGDEPKEEKRSKLRVPIRVR